MFDLFGRNKKKKNENNEQVEELRNKFIDWLEEQEGTPIIDNENLDDTQIDIDDLTEEDIEEIQLNYEERLKEIDMEMQTKGFNFNTYNEEDLHDDLQILDYYIEYNQKEEAEYLMFNIRLKEDYEEEWTEMWKCVKLLRLKGLPRTMREENKLLSIWDDVLIGLHDEDINFITLMANILKPERIGLVYCYGVQSVAETPEKAKFNADVAFAGLSQALTGNFSQIEYRLLTRQEADWIDRQMRDMKHLLMLRGIPKPRNSAGNSTTLSMGGGESTPDAEEQNEEFLRGMSDMEYLLLLLTSPVGFNDLQRWLQITSNELSKYKSEMSGTRGISAGVSIPVVFMGNLGAALGKSFGESNTFGHAVGLSETDTSSLSFSNGSSESISSSHAEGISESVSVSQGNTHSVSFSESQGLSYSEGASLTEGFSRTEGTSLSESISHSVGNSYTESFGDSISSSHSFGVSETDSLGISHSTGFSQGTSETEGFSQSMSRGESFGESMSSGNSWGNSWGNSFSNGFSTGTSDSSSLSQSQSNGFSTGTSEGTSQSASQSHSTSFGQSLTEGISHSTGTSSSVSNSHVVGESNTQTASQTHGTSESMGTSQSWGQNFSQSQSWSSSESNSQSHSESSGGSYSESNSQSASESTSSGSSISEGYSSSQSSGESSGSSQNSGISYSHSQSNSQSASQSESHSANVGTNVGFSASLSFGVKVGVEISGSGTTSDGWSAGVSESAGIGSSVSNSESVGSGYSAGLGLSHSNSYTESAGHNVGTSFNSGQSSSTGTSSGYSEGVNWSSGQSESTSESVSQGGGTSMGGSQSNGTSFSTGVSNSWGSSQAHATSQNYGTTISTGTSQSTGTTVSNGISKSEGVSSSIGTGYSQGISNSQSTSNSQGVSQSHGISNSQSNSQGSSFSNSQTNSVSNGLSHGTSNSESLGKSLSYGKSFSESETFGTSQSHSVGKSESWSEGITHSASKSYGTSVSDSVGQSQGISQSIGNSISQGQSASKGTSMSVGKSTGDSVSVSTSQGMGKSVTDSIGVSKGTSTSEGISTGKSKGSSNTDSSSLSTSSGFSHTQSTGTSSSMGLGPSVSYSKSAQWYDENKANLVLLLDEQRNRLMAALREGAFYVDVYILTPDEKAKKAASVLSTAAWYGEVFPCPVQVVEPDPVWTEHLMAHVSVFSACTSPEDNVELMEGYKFSTILLPEEVSAYCHPPRFEGGDMHTVYEAIPFFHLPGKMEGEAFLGWCISTETGKPTEIKYRISKRTMMHTLISGSSGSGKTTTSLRYISELVNNMKFGATILDWKDDWRSIAYVIPKEKFKFYSLGTTPVNRLHYNPLAVPKGVDMDLWVDTVVESFVLGFGLGQRGYEIIWRNLARLYSKNGVWKNPEKSKGLTLIDLYKEIDSEITEKGQRKQAGFGDVEAYNRVLSRMGYFTNEDSRLYSMFGNPDNPVPIEDLCEPGTVTVLEAQGMKGPQKSFLLGLISAGVFQVARAQKIFVKQPHMIVFEEAHEVVKGTDTASSDAASSGVTEESVYEMMWNEGRSAGLYLVALAQMPTHLPTSVLANTRVYITHQLGNDEDIDFVSRRMIRDPKIEHKNFPRFLEKIPLGYAIVQTRLARHHADVEPVLIKVEMIEAPRPTDDQLKSIMLERQGYLLE